MLDGDATEVAGAVLSRSAGKPIFVGLGTAAILAAGASLSWATPSPSSSSSSSASPSTTPSAAPAELAVSLIPFTTEAKPGRTARMIIEIRAKGGPVSDIKIKSVRASLPQAKVGGECPAPSFTAAACTIGELTAGKRETVFSNVLVPKDLKKTTKVTLTVTVTASKVKTKSATTQITYVVPSKPPKPPQKPPSSPSPTPSLSPGEGKGPDDKPSDGSGDKDGKGSGSGSGSGSGGNNNGSGGGNNSPYVPPRPNGSFTPPNTTPNPQVALPPIAAPSPSVAPSPAAATPESRLRNNKAPVAQDLTFERMASTQVAWLAALLVAFSLLLTQLRLGRRHGSPRSASTAQAIARSKGAHRRTRRGIFGK